MTHEDLTIADVLSDPLIRLMMRADHVSVETMEAFLVHAANNHGIQGGSGKQKHVATNTSAKTHPIRHPESAGTGTSAVPLTVVSRRAKHLTMDERTPATN